MRKTVHVVSVALLVLAAGCISAEGGAGGRAPGPSGIAGKGGSAEIGGSGLTISPATTLSVSVMRP